MFLDNMDMLESDLYGSDFDIDPIDISIWVCKDGTEVTIKDMTDNHIINCINMIKRSIRNNDPWREDYLPLFKQELISRLAFIKDANKQRVLLQSLKNI